MTEGLRRVRGLTPTGVRLVAGGVAIVAWSGLIMQFLASLVFTGNAAVALIAMARYFTVLTNLAFALTMTWIALGRRPGPAWAGGITACMFIVAAVYALLLDGFLILPGLGGPANIVMHQVSPVLAVISWLWLADKGGLRLWHAVMWLAILVAYALYALGRGVSDGVVVYPFLDFERLGWPAVLVTNGSIAAVFLAVGGILVALDRVLARKTG